jgi:hypothetical protein
LASICLPQEAHTDQNDPQKQDKATTESHHPSGQLEDETQGDPNDRQDNDQYDDLGHSRNRREAGSEKE